MNKILSQKDCIGLKCITIINFYSDNNNTVVNFLYKKVKQHEGTEAKKMFF